MSSVEATKDDPPSRIDVVAGLLLREGKALLGRRRLDVRRPDMWEMPGGKVEPSETHDRALWREWREELGLDVRVGDFLASATFELESTVSVALYQVFSEGIPICLDHQELCWVELPFAIEHLPCAPATYLHWPALRGWMTARRVARRVAVAVREDPAHTIKLLQQRLDVVEPVYRAAVAMFHVGVRKTFEMESHLERAVDRARDLEREIAEGRGISDADLKRPLL